MAYGCTESSADVDFPALVIEDDTDFLTDKDIDGDGTPDKVLFEFTGGAHCCYRLTVELSSDGIEYNFPFDIDGGYTFGVPDNSQPQHFNMMDYDKDGRTEIYVEIETYNGVRNQIPESWKDLYGITAHNIIIDFEDTLRIINIPDYISIEQFYYQREQTFHSSRMIPFKKRDRYNGIKFGFRNELDEVVILPILDSVTPFSNEAAIVTLNSKTVLINKSGEILSRFEDFHLMDQQIKNDWPILVADRTISGFYYIDKEGNVLNQIPYLDAKSFTEGVAAVQLANEKWGYIDVNNAWLISPQFKHAHPFDNETALVEMRDTMFFIDKKGNLIKM